MPKTHSCQHDFKETIYQRNSNQLTSGIIAKWNAQGAFIRFIDGNTMNCSVANLQWVTLPEVIQHITDWVVDWDLNLTKQERDLVMKSEWRAGLSFKSRN